MEEKNKKKYALMDMPVILMAAAIISALGGIIGMFFVPALKWWFGAAFGYAVGLLCFRLLYLDIKRSVSAGEGRAKAVAVTSYMFRYLIKGAALYVSFKSEFLSFGSCIIGLLSINAAIHILNFINICLAKSREKE